jgi:menaquinol-cytochrome c reductase cytochrome b/c subunit
MLLALAGITYLTWESVAHHDWEAAAEQGKIVAEVEFDKEDEGYKIFEANGCISCHGGDLQGGAGSPALVDTGLTPEEVADIAKNGKGAMPAGMFKGTDEELQKMAEFISGLESK